MLEFKRQVRLKCCMLSWSSSFASIFLGYYIDKGEIASSLVR